MSSTERGKSAAVAEYKTDSERMFADYLERNEFRKWEYEPVFEGKSKRPDFLVRHEGQELIFEVKERQGKPAPPDPQDDAREFQPVAGIRRTISQAKKNLKGFREYACSVVIANFDRDTRTAPRHVYSAMLGVLGQEWGVGPGVTAENAKSSNVFLPKGGKMRDHKHSAFQSKRISSIIILREDSLRNREFETVFVAAVREQEQRKRRALSSGDKAILSIELGFKLGVVYERAIRVVVHEHPIPRHPLPEEIFRGPYDERYRWEEGSIRRIFAGDSLSELDENRQQDDDFDLSSGRSL